VEPRTERRPPPPETGERRLTAAGPLREALPAIGPTAPREPEGTPELHAPGSLRPRPAQGLEADTAGDDLGRLAERMRRILAEEARRHGIDV